MRGIWSLVLLLSGCAMYFGPDDDSRDPRPDPGYGSGSGYAPVDAATPGLPEPTSTCPADVSMNLTDHNYSLIPLDLDESGTILCVRLDSSAMTHPTYFEARTPMQSGTVASFGVSIYDADGVLLESGYDAPIGGNQTYATATLDYWRRNWNQSIHYVKVHARSRQGVQATELHLTFYQVLD